MNEWCVARLFVRVLHGLLTMPPMQANYLQAGQLSVAAHQPLWLHAGVDLTARQRQGIMS